MAKNKNSFILYTDLIHTVKKMPREKAGDLFVLILQYVNDENPVPDDILLELVFEPIKQQLKRDLKSWESTRESRSLGGKKGMEKRWKTNDNSVISDITNDNSVIQTITKITVNDNVNVNDNTLSLVDKKIDSEVSDNIKPKKIATEKPLWFTDYNVYLESARNAYNNALNDGKLKERMQALYHNINYEGTLEVMFANYWGTEAGWQNKKKAKINTINWPATIRNGFSTKFNRIYFPKQTL